MDFYKRGFGSVATPTIAEALKSIRGTKIETIAPNTTEVWDLQILQANRRWRIWWLRIVEKKAGRPMKVHTNWFCQGFKPNIRVANFGNAMQKAMLSDSRNVVPGDAPWSKLGEYGNNVKLQHGGKPFAIVNFGNSVKPTRQGTHIPISDIFDVKSDEKERNMDNRSNFRCRRRIL